LLQRGNGARYVSSGHLIFGSGSNLVAVPFDPERLEVTGSPVTVLPQIAITAGGGTNVAVSASGTLAYVPGGGAAADQRVLVWVDRMGGREQLVPAPPRTYQIARLSPDGTRVALDIRDGDNDIWVYAFGPQTITRLTSAVGNDMFPVWSSDGAHVVYQTAPDARGFRHLAWRPADAARDAEVLLESSQPVANYRPYGLAGRDTLVVGFGNDIMMLPLVPTTGGRALSPLIKTSFAEQNAEVSPDGRWVAYQSNESGRDEVYVRPFPGVDEGRWLVSTNGGRKPTWARNGTELFYVAPDGAIMAARVGAASSWSNAPAAQIVAAGYFDGGEVMRTFDVSADGSRFLVIKQLGNLDGAGRNIILVQNWHEELKRRVPVP
jgi:hypothetical protein